jgi:hypothetical protein
MSAFIKRVQERYKSVNNILENGNKIIEYGIAHLNEKEMLTYKPSNIDNIYK